MKKHTEYGKDLEIGKLYYPTYIKKHYKEILNSQIFLCVRKDNQSTWLYNIKSGTCHDVYNLGKLHMQELTK